MVGVDKKLELVVGVIKHEHALERRDGFPPHCELRCEGIATGFVVYVLQKEAATAEVLINALRQLSELHFADTSRKNG